MKKDNRITLTDGERDTLKACLEYCRLEIADDLNLMSSDRRAARFALRLTRLKIEKIEMRLGLVGGE